MSCATRLPRYRLLLPGRWPLAGRVLLDLLSARKRIRASGPDRWCVGWDGPAPPGPTGRALTDRDLDTLECVRRWSAVLLTVLFRQRRRQCLPRSLVLFRHARRLGLAASWHMGFHRAGVDRDGHSWVAIAGQPLFEPEDLAEQIIEAYRYPK